MFSSATNTWHVHDYDNSKSSIEPHGACFGVDDDRERLEKPMRLLGTGLPGVERAEPAAVSLRTAVPNER